MEKEKTKSKKWIIAVVLIAVIVIAIAIYLNIFSIPTGLIAGTSTGEASQTSAKPTFTVTGNEIIAEELENLNLPYEKNVDLEAARYSIQFTSDEPVWMFLYEESYYNNWKSTGKIQTAMTSTGCCREEQKKTDFSNTFDIGKTGKYYIIFRGPETTNIKYKITQLFKV